MSDTTHISTTLEGIAALTGALAWPSVAVLFGFVYRAQISQSLTVLVDKLSKATSIKAVGFELATELIGEAISQPIEIKSLSASAAAVEVPVKQVQSASKLKNELNTAGLQQEATIIAFETVSKLAKQYDDLRSRLSSSPARTEKMDELLGRMRTLGLLVRPFLPVLTTSTTPGKRLAAIASLQIMPDSDYLIWLGSRFSSETPFMFYQAAIALRQLSRQSQAGQQEMISIVLGAALHTVSSFTHGIPDERTISVLKQAIQEIKL